MRSILFCGRHSLLSTRNPRRIDVLEQNTTLFTLQWMILFPAKRKFPEK